jgi:hypothetical protein
MGSSFTQSSQSKLMSQERRVIRKLDCPPALEEAGRPLSDSPSLHPHGAVMLAVYAPMVFLSKLEGGSSLPHLAQAL